MSRHLLPSLILAAALVGAAGAALAQPPPAPPTADGDHITLQQFIAERGRLFDRIDANHDGQITSDEVAAFKARRENAQAGGAIRSGRMRRGGEGQIDQIEEFTANGPLTRAQWDAVLTKRFQRLDSQGLGYITREQMRGNRRGGQGAAPSSPPT